MQLKVWVDKPRLLIAPGKTIEISTDHKESLRVFMGNREPEFSENSSGELVSTDDAAIKAIEEVRKLG